MSTFYKYRYTIVRQGSLDEACASAATHDLPPDLTRAILRRGGEGPYAEMALRIEQDSSQVSLWFITPGFISMMLSSNTPLELHLGGFDAINHAHFKPDLDSACLAYAVTARGELPDDPEEPRRFAWDWVELRVWIASRLIEGLKPSDDTAAWSPDDAFLEFFPPPDPAARLRVLGRHTPWGGTTYIDHVSLDPLGLWALVVAEAGDIVRYDLRTAAEVARASPDLGHCPRLAPRPSQTAILSVDCFGAASMLDAETLRAQRIPDKGLEGVSRMFWSADGRLVYVCPCPVREDEDLGEIGLPGYIAILDAIDAEQGTILYRHSATVDAACLAADVLLGASADANGQLAVWTLDAPLWVQETGAKIADLALSPDGRTLWVLATENRSVVLRRLNARTGEREDHWWQGSQEAGVLALFPDGETLALLTGHTLRLLDASKGSFVREIALAPRNESPIWLMSASADRLVVVYKQLDVIIFGLDTEPTTERTPREIAGGVYG